MGLSPLLRSVAVQSVRLTGMRLSVAAEEIARSESSMRSRMASTSVRAAAMIRNSSAFEYPDVEGRGRFGTARASRLCTSGATISHRGGSARRRLSTVIESIELLIPATAARSRRNPWT